MMNSIDKTHCKTYSQDSIPSFIRKTYEILEENKHPDIIDWNPEGTALVIKKSTEFCQKVLPCYFKHSNLTSFIRQLNMYNFHKKRTHTMDHIYYHELFQRGKRYLLKGIKRKTPDSNFDKGYKTPELSDTSQGMESSTLLYENHTLKKLYKDAIAKIQVLENQIKELTAQNESLLDQTYKNGDTNSNTFYQPNNNTNIPHDQFSTIVGTGYLPYNEYGMEHQVPSQNVVKATNPVQPYYNTNNNEHSNESTEASLPNMENDRGMEWNEFTPSTAQDFFPEDAFQLPQCQLMKPVNEQLFCGNNMQYIGSQTNNNNNNLIQVPIQQSYSVLGKRQFDTVSPGSQIQSYEPVPKRFEVCNYNENRLEIPSQGCQLGVSQANYNPGYYSWTQ